MGKHRPRTLRRLAWAAWAMLAFAGCEGAGGPSGLRAGPYLQNVQPDRVTVMWETAAILDARVRYEADGVQAAVVEAPAARLHHLVLAPLAPGTRYTYEIQSGNAVLGSGSFKTAPDGGPYRFAVWGDSQTQPEEFAKVVARMADSAPDFAVTVGDLVNNGSNVEQWHSRHFAPLSSFAAQVPLFAAIGNHDYECGLPGCPGAAMFAAYFANPGNGFYYSFDYGNGHFVVLDPFDEAPGTVAFDPAGAQAAWLTQDLGSERAKAAAFRFVFVHQPPFSEYWDGAGYDGEAALRDNLVPLLERFGVDLVFSGHTHDYQRGARAGVHYVITGGGGSALDTVRNRDWDEIDVGLAVHHFVSVEVDGGVLDVQATDTGGRVVDAFSVRSRTQP